jgi:hypothetical protein
MGIRAEATGDPSAAHLRRGLVWLAALGTVTTALELAFLRHWDNVLELTPWAALALLATAIVPLIRRATARRLRWARAVAIATGVVAAVGVAVHVWRNYESAPLDYRYTASWPTTPEPVRWLLAFTDTVGPSPSLAPSALAFVCVCLLLATVRHPLLARADGGA